MGLAVQAGDRLTEHLGVPLHVLFRGPRSDECHVVKRCHQDVTVEREEVHVSIQLLVYGRGGFRTVPWRLGPEPIFGAAAETFHDPGAVSYTHLRAHETDSYLVCRLLLEKKKKNKSQHIYTYI